jgi:hypothetical protein
MVAVACGLTSYYYEGIAPQHLQVSQRVRRLDVAQTNLVATIEHIQLVVSSGACISAVRRALDSDDFEALAESISSYQQLMQQAGDTKGPRESTASTALDLGQPADAVVMAAREKLLEHVRQGVKSTLQAQDADAASRYLKLYRPLELPEEGIAAALSFVKRYARLPHKRWCLPGKH